MLAHVATFLVVLVALLHCMFFVLESFLWTTPLGLKRFQMTQEVANSSAILAANQGFYNFLLALGLIASLFFKSPDIRFAFQVFFLGSVVLAGIYGGFTTGPRTGPRILCLQALPALLGLICVALSRN